MWQNIFVAVAFMLAAAWVAWSVVLPRTVRNHIRSCMGKPQNGGAASGECGGCCGGCGSEEKR